MIGSGFLGESSQNETTLSEVLILGFQGLNSYRFVLFTAIIILFTLIQSGNALIILVTWSNELRHSPMYFFLCNLSFSEMLSTTIIIPNMLQVILRNGVTMSLSGCLTQFYLFANFVMIESYLLTAMSYDRYLAICRPLHYSSIMHLRFCCYLSLVCWVSSSIVTSIVLSFILNLHFCAKRNVIDHFFCDMDPVLSLSCSDTSIVHLVAYIISPLSLIFPFVFIIVTYVCIILSILKIQSVTGKKKAFSTCSSHLFVVISYYITLITVYLVPTSDYYSQINKILSLLYTVMTPLLNPFIYSLSNREIRATLSLNIKRNYRISALGISIQK
ncbi:hypothetical protein GDO86_017716 [Hymenochirus boettgeri]|uniref:Olfactory receptor n=1 Tax=Hymenochirus boettgeri TaxID=247094 RepID=A0A8T2IPL5_9PIPI|nr:hypothetical protein GDO86_017716 [Hymenochirus boettgeri]